MYANSIIVQHEPIVNREINRNKKGCRPKSTATLANGELIFIKFHYASKL